MDDFDLLAHVQPQYGFFCLFSLLGGKNPKQELVSTREEAQNIIELRLSEKRDVYFAIAKFKNVEGKRKKENVELLKCFWVDIDCGEDKAATDEKTGRPDGYIDRETGKKELEQFCETVGLPIPTLVNSGRGIHAYWVLDEEITRAEWEPIVDRLRYICEKQEFYVDPSVFEASRVLRVPGTLNFKSTPPSPVAVEHIAETIGLAEIKDILGVEDTKVKVNKLVTLEEPEHVLPNPTKERQQDNIESSFKRIMSLSVKGEGCNQLLSCYMDRETLAEPRWRSGLSIIEKCVDRDQAIRIFSEGHPSYSFEAADQKARNTGGPHSCLEFERNNPGACDGCKHKNSITTPIMLGRQLIEPPVVIDNSNVYSLFEGKALEEKPNNLPVSYRTLIDGYKKGATGGIYKVPSDGGDPVLVTDYLLFVEKVLIDAKDGNMVLLELHTPKDGIDKFMIPTTAVSQKLELQKELAKRGILPDGGKYDVLQKYIADTFRYLKDSQKADIMRRQFGWAEGDSKFIVGDREITADGIRHNPPSPITEPLMPYFEKAGTLENWKDVFSLYGLEGMEVQAFAALSGFGAPLLKFTGQKGCIINLVHRYAGTGKTTILRMANSVCGHPEKLLGTVDDTKVAKITKVGILNNIVNTVDEITNTDPKEFSDLVYAYSQGKGKDKSEQTENKLRVNTTTWSTPTLTSSNASFYAKVASKKAVADGEMMRLLEFTVDYTSQDLITTSNGKHMFDHVLNNNYGWAIEVFMEWVIANLEEVKVAVVKMQNKLDKELNFTSRERNWCAQTAVNFVGGLIAENLGLLEGWHLQKLYKVITDELRSMRIETKAPASNALNTISDYIYRHQDCILKIKNDVDLRTNVQESAIVQPKFGKEIAIRYEPDTELMYIKIKHIAADCVNQQADLKEIKKELLAKGMLLKSKNKRLTKGMAGDIAGLSGVSCMVIDCSNKELLPIDNLINTESKDASGESVIQH